MKYNVHKKKFFFDKDLFELYKNLKGKYGPFEERYDFTKMPYRPKQEEINVNENGVITGESKILETPVAVLKKVIEYY